MVELVSLPSPDDETGLKAALMQSARFACEDSAAVVAYSIVALYADGRRAVGGITELEELAPMNATTFALMVSEEARAHFVTQPNIDRALYIDQEC